MPSPSARLTTFFFLTDLGEQLVDPMDGVRALVVNETQLRRVAQVQVTGHVTTEPAGRGAQTTHQLFALLGPIWRANSETHVDSGKLQIVGHLDPGDAGRREPGIPKLG